MSSIGLGGGGVTRYGSRLSRHVEVDACLEPGDPTGYTQQDILTLVSLSRR